MKGKGVRGNLAQLHDRLRSAIMMMMIYIIYAANWVGIIEVPLGANVIPKGTALEYSVNIPLSILRTVFYGRTF